MRAKVQNPQTIRMRGRDETFLSIFIGQHHAICPQTRHKFAVQFGRTFFFLPLPVYPGLQFDRRSMNGSKYCRHWTLDVTRSVASQTIVGREEFMNFVGGFVATQARRPPRHVCGRCCGIDRWRWRPLILARQPLGRPWLTLALDSDGDEPLSDHRGALAIIDKPMHIALRIRQVPCGCRRGVSMKRGQWPDCQERYMSTTAPTFEVMHSNALAGTMA